MCVSGGGEAGSEASSESWGQRDQDEGAGEATERGKEAFILK